MVLFQNRIFPSAVDMFVSMRAESDEQRTRRRVEDFAPIHTHYLCVFSDFALRRRSWDVRGKVDEQLYGIACTRPTPPLSFSDP